MTSCGIINAITQCLQKHRKEFPDIRSLSFDGDNDSCELMVDYLDHGEHATIVISSRMLREVYNHEDWDEDGKAPPRCGSTDKAGGD